MIANIPFENIDRIQIYINTQKKTLSQIKQETGANYLINGTLYDMSTYKAVCHLKSNGTVYCKPSYTTWGYSWNNDSIPIMEVIPNTKTNNIACVYMIRNGKKEVMHYDSALGGIRGRSAIGLTKDALILYCTKDGSSEAMTPATLQSKMLNLGCKDAIMLDGGGSSQCNFNGETITSSRKVQNLILVYLKKEVDKLSTKKVILDPGHDSNNVNGSPDGTYKEHEFALDMGNRIKKILERSGVEVFMTRTNGNAATLKQRCDMANAIVDLDLFVSLHSNAAGSSSTDSNGWSAAKGWSAHIIATGGNAEKAAKALVNEVKSNGVTVRNASIVTSDFQVLRDTNAPAVLIEHGFHTNKEEVELLKTDSYRQKLSESEAKGILSHLGLSYVEENGNTSSSTHWAQKNFDNLVARGIQLSDTRFDDNITRGEAFALADKILTTLGK